MSVTRIDLLDAASRARYDALFEACPSAFIQQSTAWAEVIGSLGADEPHFLLHSRDGVDCAALPLYVFRHPLGNVINSVPQAGPLGGVFLRAGLPQAGVEDAYRELMDAAVDLARGLDCLSLTLISNPFAPDVELYERHLRPTYVLENFTQYVSLTDEAPGRRLAGPQVSRQLTRNLRRAEQAGFTLEVASSPSSLDEWYPIHCKRHAELGLAPLPRALFSGILRVLGPRGLAELLFVRHQGRLASGCIFIRHRDVQDVFLLSMDTTHTRLSPNYYLTERSLRRAAGAGVRIYNWQSSPDREGGVYAFKRQWGALEAPYAFVTRLFCPPDRIARIGLDQLRREYPGHYVIPFGVFTEGFDRRTFQKAGAGAR